MHYRVMLRAAIIRELLIIVAILAVMTITIVKTDFILNKAIVTSSSVCILGAAAGNLPGGSVGEGVGDA